MALKYNVLSRNIKHKGYSTLEFVDVEHDSIDQKKKIRKTLELFTAGDSAAGIIYHTQLQQLFFVKQFRFAVADIIDPWLLEVVAGGVDKDEAPEEAIRREILEETGFETNDLEHIQSFFVTPGRSSEYLHLYYAETSSKPCETGGLEEENEDIEIIGVDKKNLTKLLPQVHDAKTIVAIQWFLRNKC